MNDRSLVPILSMLSSVVGLTYGCDNDKNANPVESSNASSQIPPKGHQSATDQGRSRGGASGSAGGGSDREGTVNSPAASPYMDGAIQNQGNSPAPASSRSSTQPVAGEGEDASSKVPGFNTSGQELIDK
jgi:hypothetical protein